MGCQQDRFGKARNCSFFIYKDARKCRTGEGFCSDNFFPNDYRYWSQLMCMRCSMAMDTQELLHEEDVASAIQGGRTGGVKELWKITFCPQCETEQMCGVESLKMNTQTLHED